MVARELVQLVGSGTFVELLEELVLAVAVFDLIVSCYQNIPGPCSVLDQRLPHLGLLDRSFPGDRGVIREE